MHRLLPYAECQSRGWGRWRRLRKRGRAEEEEVVDVGRTDGPLCGEEGLGYVALRGAEASRDRNTSFELESLEVHALVLESLTHRTIG